MKNHSKIFLILLISSFFTFYPLKTLNGCGGDGYYPEDDFYNLVNPEILKNPGYRPFYLTDSYYSYPSEDTLFNGEYQNIKEWSGYFQQKVSETSIRKFVYEYSPTELSAIKAYVEKGKKSDAVPDILSFFKALKNTEAVNYILYVRELAPFVEGIDQWEGCAHDMDIARGLLTKGEVLYKQAKSEFIKMRLGYQLSRLAHYSGEYQKAVTYFDSFVAPYSSESSIKYKALGHKAGALKALGNMSEATYLFSIVFANSFEKRLQAFRSIDYNGDYFNDALELCKNNDEKVILYFLKALDQVDSYSEEILETIYALKPTSRELEHLIMIKLKRHEYYISESGFDNYNDKALKDFIVSCAEKGDVRDQALWYFFAGYIDYLNGDYVNAASFLSKVNSSNTNDKRLLTQVRIVDHIVKIELKDTIDLDFEDQLIAEFKSIKDDASTSSEMREELNKGYSYYFNRLGEKYLAQGENLKAALCKNAYSGMDLKSNPDEEKIDELIEFLNKTNKTPMEIFLIEKFHYTKASLFEIKGTLALRSADFKKAVEYFNEAESEIAKSEKSYGDPFEFAINNCIECGIGEEGKKYSKLEFAKKMLEYESLAATNNSKAAYYYYQLGNGLYNTSYYGSSYNMTEYFRSYALGGNSSDVVYTLKTSEGKPDDDAIKKYYLNLRGQEPLTQNFDCTIAMEYFQKAMNLAKDKELAAKACYMAAKCEESNRYQGIVDIDNGLGKHKYYKILKDKYAGTEFYNEVLGECIYFNNYVKDPL